jgi:hypothetical protein
LPIQSLATPAKIFVTAAVDSAMPSISPTVNVLKPSTPTKKTGSKLWIISEETSINMLTNPSAITPRGNVRLRLMLMPDAVVRYLTAILQI